MMFAKHLRRDRAHGDGGFTLLEVIVSMAVLAAIITPLTMAFITMLQRSRVVEDQMSRSADAQRIGAAWTRDVQSVEPGGVNSSICPGSGDLPETNLVSFSWNGSSTAGGPKRTASWVAVGNGSNLQIVRRFCENDAPAGTAVLAEKVANNGDSALAVVHGPSTTAPSEFCPATDRDPGAGTRLVSDACTIKIDGSFTYGITVARRVPYTDQTAAVDIVPGPPTSVVANGRNTYINVTYAIPVGAFTAPDQYRAFAYLDPAGNPVASGSTESGTSINIEGLDNAKKYYVRVQAHNPVGWGELSSPVYGPVSLQTTAPEAPTLSATVTPGDTKLTVSWTPPTNNGGSAITSWKLWAVDSTNAVVGPQTVSSAGAITADVTGLTNGKSYRVRLAAVNAIGTGVEAITPDYFVPFGAPGPATITEVKQKDNGDMTITWAAPTANGPNASVPDGGSPITGYRVRVKLTANPVNAPGGPWPSASTFTAADIRSIDMSGLTLGATYTFEVVTQNLGGTSVSAGSAATLSRALPGAPATVTVSRVANQNGQIKVDWTAGATNGAPLLGSSGYEITSSPATVTKTVSGTTLTTTFTGLTSGTTYTFTVRAQNEAGYGPGRTSSGLSALGPPTAPQSLSLSRPGGSFGQELSLSFGAVANNGGESPTYSISCTAPSGTPINRGPYGSGGTIMLTGSDVRDGRSYTCTVTATNGGGSASATSNAAISYGECTMEAVEDTWIKSDSQDTNYGNEGVLKVSPDSRKWALMRFPLTNGTCVNVNQAIPSAASFTSSSLRVYMYDYDTVCCWPGSIYADVKVSTISGTWTETGATWRNTGGLTSIGQNVRLTDSTGPKTWTVDPAMLNTMKAGYNSGVVLSADGSGYQRMRDMYFCSRQSGCSASDEPRLSMVFYSQGP